MNDMTHQIADILLQDHVELMRQNKEMREALHSLLDEVYPEECWTPEHIEFEKAVGNMMAPVIERAYAALKSSGSHKRVEEEGK